MEELGNALKWACEHTLGHIQSIWKFQLGAWYAGKDQIDEALHVLKESGDDRAKALAARLYRCNKQDYEAAALSFRQIQFLPFALHPQVTYERDLVLAALGSRTLVEREYWLKETSALEDECLIERRVALLADLGKWTEAKKLLEGTSFQLIHQCYSRTKLWKRIN